jgi:iron donor protein CyaY
MEKNMDESTFIELAEEYLESLFDQLEAEDADAVLDMDYAEGVLTILHEPTGKQFIVNRHAVGQEIWLSSPLSGGHHLKLAQKDELTAMLKDELGAL